MAVLGELVASSDNAIVSSEDCLPKHDLRRRWYMNLQWLYSPVYSAGCQSRLDLPLTEINTGPLSTSQRFSKIRKITKASERVRVVGWQRVLFCDIYQSHLRRGEREGVELIYCVL